MHDRLPDNKTSSDMQTTKAADFAGQKAEISEALDALVADPSTVSTLYTTDATWLGSHPWNARTGPTEIQTVWEQLHGSFEGLTRRAHLVAMGENQPDDRVPAAGRAAVLFASMGVLEGRFTDPLFGIPATGDFVQLRICEVHEPKDGQIARSWVLIDLLDLMEQTELTGLPHTGGVPGPWPGPAASNPSASGAESLAEVLAMHRSITQTTGEQPGKTGYAKHWTEDFLWAGPGGIGMTRGLEDFRTFHQLPFLEAFPDRGGAGHYIRIGDGDLAVTGGWPSVVATHKGPYLGIDPTGERVGMRVMDFYRLVDGRIAENWVPIDMINLALQMGIHLLPDDPTKS